MKRIVHILSILFVSTSVVLAGNPERIGQAGGTQLNINGWGKSAGWGWSGVSNSHGLEAMFMNMGGLAYTEKTEIIFSRTAWLVGSDVNVNTFGLAQKLGGDGVLGITVMSLDLGDIEVTSTEQPDAELGTYSPSFTNISVGYSKRFTKSISGGVAAKVFSESITNAKAQGFVVDAGILYQTSSNADDKSKQNDVKFGVSLKNIGPDARYAGDGLSAKLLNPSNNVEQTVSQRTAKFNMPTLVNISASYDMRLDKTDETYFHRLTPALTFTNNAFARNQFTLGMEYGYKSVFQLRAGFVYEEGAFDYNERYAAHTGAVGGFSFEVPVAKGSNTNIALDYAYRHSNPFSGSHTVGLRLDIGAEK